MKTLHLMFAPAACNSAKGGLHKSRACAPRARPIPAFGNAQGSRAYGCEGRRPDLFGCGADGSGFQPLFPCALPTSALPKAGMGAGLWPSNAVFVQTATFCKSLLLSLFLFKLSTSESNEGYPKQSNGNVAARKRPRKHEIDLKCRV